MKSKEYYLLVVPDNIDMNITVFHCSAILLVKFDLLLHL